MTRWFAALAILVSFAAAAEPAYVTDRSPTALRANPAETAAPVRTLDAGELVEVLDRQGAFARVRDARGVEGWVETSALAAQPPTSAQVRALRAELERTRAQLVNAQTQLDQGRSTAAPVAKLQAELASAREQLAQAQTELQQTKAALAEARADIERRVAAPTNASATAPAATDSGFPWLWLGIAFAMLGIGFAGGIFWVRESIRRRMGGMYLRI